MIETLQKELSGYLKITIASIKDTIGIQQRRQKMQIRKSGLSDLNLLHHLSMHPNIHYRLVADRRGSMNRTFRSQFMSMVKLEFEKLQN